MIPHRIFLEQLLCSAAAICQGLYHRISVLDIPDSSSNLSRIKVRGSYTYTFPLINQFAVGMRLSFSQLQGQEDSRSPPGHPERR